MGWRHDVATPRRPQSNGAAEAAVARVIEGTRALLLKSGLAHEWWREAATCFPYLRNITDVIDGKTPYKLRHGESFPGMRLPFGCAIDYKPQAER